MITQRPVLSVLLPALLVACVATPEQKPELSPMNDMLELLTEQKSTNCIEFRNIESHEVLDEGVISVSMRRGGHYLVTTSRHCHFSKNSPGILISDGWGKLCRGSGTIVDDFQSCTVGHIYEFPTRDAAMATLKVAQARREAEAMIPNQDPEPAPGDENQR